MLCLIAIIGEYIFPELDVWRIKWILGKLPVFFIGMYIAEFDLTKNVKKYMLSALCLVLAIVTRCFLGGGFNWTYFLAAAMPLICATLCHLRYICIKIHVYRFIELTGLYSLEIYLIHEYTY